MANLELKVSDLVKAVNYDYYGITNSRHCWVGEVISVDKYHGTFSARTVSIKPNCYKISEGELFSSLEANTSLFAITKSTPKAKEKEKDNTILRAVKRDNRIFIEYRGKCIASSGCDEHDKFDEEFGLNLALRRACNKLKDTHEITDIESVEDYL